jgi:hypothetical protein
MLEKEPGNLLITKLRVIQPLEADMNFAFRLLWGKRLVHHALSHNALTPLNFGGRPGCRVHSALLLKTLSYDYICYTCLNAIIFNNDAKACFDRIIPSIGLMATERLSMPPTATASMLAIIKGMKFHIRTAHGISPGLFKTTLPALILGVLQGSGAALCIWLSISCVLLHALSPHTTGFQATCPQNYQTSKRPGEAFVDDTDLWLTSTNLSSSLTLIPSMQKVAQLWERLLVASGGALAIQECFYYLVDWHWDHNGFAVLSSNLAFPGPQLVLTSGRSTSSTSIPRVESSIGIQILGMRLSPDGSFTEEFTHHQNRALKWVTNINTAPLIREETYTAYCTMWRPSFEFPLSVTSFTKKQCNILQRIFTGPFLAKMGISRTTSRVLIFAPYRYSGFALLDTWVQQGLQHLHFLLGHLSYQDKVGNLLKINNDTLQLIIIIIIKF